MSTQLSRPILATAVGLIFIASCRQETAPNAPPAELAEVPAQSSREPAVQPPETSAPEFPAPAQGLPLTPGVYVLAGESCAAPSNAGFRVYDGQGISGSATRECRATVRSRDGDAFQVDQSCVGTYSGERTSTAQTIRIPDAERFTLTEADETSTFRLCPAGEAPDHLQDLVTPD